jgi:hypothetical protein
VWLGSILGWSLFLFFSWGVTEKIRAQAMLGYMLASTCSTKYHNLPDFPWRRNFFGSMIQEGIPCCCLVSKNNTTTSTEAATQEFQRMKVEDWNLLRNFKTPCFFQSVHYLPYVRFTFFFFTLILPWARDCTVVFYLSILLLSEALSRDPGPHVELCNLRSHVSSPTTLLFTS